MQRFSQLYADLDRTTKTNAKVRAMVDYFQEAPPEDAAWAVFFLTGQRLKRLISGRALRHWALGATGLPDWLATDCHAAVGDSAETVSLLVDQGLVEPEGAPVPLHRWMEERILPLRGEPIEMQEATVTSWWSELPRAEIFLLNKLLTGGFRVGVSKLLVVRALAEVADLPRPVISHRLMGHWQPTADGYKQLLDPETESEDRSKPYPFFLASPLEQEPSALGPIEDWFAEWKWDGIRGQLIRRGGETFLWTRGEELVTERYPELVLVAEKLPNGVVIDGEILAWDDNGVMPFSVLQKRIGRDKLGQKILKEAPVGFLAYDLLEEQGDDLRELPMADRRHRLEAGCPRGRRTFDDILAAGRDELVCPCRDPRRGALAPGRRLDAETQILALPHRPAAGRLVEVEDRSSHDRRRSDLRPGRLRQARQSVHGLHFRGLAGRRVGADRQGLFRFVGPGNPDPGPLDQTAHDRALRSGPPGRAAPRVRTRFRRHQSLHPTQVRRRPSLPQNLPLAQR